MTRPPENRRWLIQQGRSSATVSAPDYETARERGKRIGFPHPETIRLLD